MKISITVYGTDKKDCDKKAKILKLDGWTRVSEWNLTSLVRDSKLREFTMTKNFKKKVKKVKVVKPILTNILSDPYLDLITGKLESFQE